MRCLLLIYLCFATAVQTGNGASYFARPAAGGGGPLFTDNFNRADSTDIGTNWLESNLNTAISGNALRVGGTALGLALTTTAAHADTAELKVTVTQKSSTGDGGPVARVTTGGAAPTMYACDVFTGTIALYRHNASASGTELATAAITQVANGIIAIDVRGTGATVTIKCYYNGVEKINFGDTSGSRITAAGRPGVYNWVGPGVTSDYEDFQVDP